MSASWGGDLTVTEAVDAVVDEEDPANSTPARIVATTSGPGTIIESAPWLAEQVQVTVIMAAGAPLPATVGQTLTIRTRVL